MGTRTVMGPGTFPPGDNDTLWLDPRLVARAKLALVQADEIGCGRGDTGYDLAAALGAAAEELAAAIERSDSRDERARLLAVLQEVHRLQCDVHAGPMHRRAQAISDAVDGIRRLHGIDHKHELLRRLADEACRSCGFARCIVARVVDGRWCVEAARFTDDAQAATAFTESAVSITPTLDGIPLEGGLLRRRADLLVDASGHESGVLAMIGCVGLQPPYVVCPIVVRRRVVGLVYGGGTREPDDIDRGALVLLAGGVALLYERTVLLAKLRAQRNHVQQMASSARSTMTELCDPDVELLVGSEPVRTSTVAPNYELAPELTARELEVLGLMAAGLNNAGIAERLFLAEGTVKSHVKHVLRKMSATNRAEAVACYLHHQLEEQA